MFSIGTIVVVGTHKTPIPQRIWAIRVDSVLKLDRAANRESNDDNDEGAPLKGIS